MTIRGRCARPNWRAMRTSETSADATWLTDTRASDHATSMQRCIDFTFHLRALDKERLREPTLATTTLENRHSAERFEHTKPGFISMMRAAVSPGSSMARLAARHRRRCRA